VQQQGKIKMKTATLIKKLTGFEGDSRLYKLSEPLENFEHVVVSAVYAMMSGPETYIFGANKKGEIQNWGELEGSFRGSLNHREALEGAGYTVK
jgi:hypothetical protein